MNDTFNKYFNDNIDNELKDLEKEKKVIFFKNYVLVFLIIIPLIIISFFIPYLQSARYYILGLGILLAFLINFFIYNFNNREERFYNRLKQIFIPLLLSKYRRSYNYKPEKSLSIKVFYESGLYGDSFQQHEGRDYIKMEYPEYGFDITFSLIHTLIVHRKNCRTSRLHVFTGFKGYFIVINKIDKPELIEKIKKHFSSWDFNEDKKYLYFARKNNLELCKPSIFKSILNPETFRKEFELLDEVFGIKY